MYMCLWLFFLFTTFPAFPPSSCVLLLIHILDFWPQTLFRLILPIGLGPGFTNKLNLIYICLYRIQSLIELTQVNCSGNRRKVFYLSATQSSGFIFTSLFVCLFAIPCGYEYADHPTSKKAVLKHLYDSTQWPLQARPQDTLQHGQCSQLLDRTSHLLSIAGAGPPELTVTPQNSFSRILPLNLWGLHQANSWS